MLVPLRKQGDFPPAADVGAGLHAVKLASGEWHTCAILNDASLKCWGVNTAGELGATKPRTALDSDPAGFVGTSPGDMGNNLLALDLGDGRTAADVGAGKAFTCVLLDNGEVKCFGTNGYGQRGAAPLVAHSTAIVETIVAIPPCLGCTQRESYNNMLLRRVLEGSLKEVLLRSVLRRRFSRDRGF